MYVPKCLLTAGGAGAMLNRPGIRPGALGHDHGQADGVKPATHQPPPKAGS
jgi:hypothetical protein